MKKSIRSLEVMGRNSIFALANRIGLHGTEFLFYKVKATCGRSSGTQRIRSNGSVCSACGDFFNLIKTANR